MNGLRTSWRGDDRGNASAFAILKPIHPRPDDDGAAVVSRATFYVAPWRHDDRAARQQITPTPLSYWTARQSTAAAD